MQYNLCHYFSTFKFMTQPTHINNMSLQLLNLDQELLGWALLCLICPQKQHNLGQNELLAFEKVQQHLLCESCRHSQSLLRMAFVWWPVLSMAWLEAVSVPSPPGQLVGPVAVEKRSSGAAATNLVAPEDMKYSANPEPAEGSAAPDPL